MSECQPNLDEAENNLAPIIGIGGLMSFKRQAGFYAPILHTPGSELSISDRFMAIPDGGRLDGFDEMFGQLDEEFESIVERLQEPAVLVAHSLGTYFATELAMAHPDKVVAVNNMAGVDDGIKQMTLAGELLKQLVGNPEHAEELFEDSDRMIDHKRRRATNWPAHIIMKVYSPTHDILVPAPQGLDPELPEGQQAENYIVVPALPGTDLGIRRKTRHLENVRHLRSWLPADHITIAWCPPVISNIHQSRKLAAAPPSPETASTMRPTPHFDAVAAAA